MLIKSLDILSKSNEFNKNRRFSFPWSLVLCRFEVVLATRWLPDFPHVFCNRATSFARFKSFLCGRDRRDVYGFNSLLSGCRLHGHTPGNMDLYGRTMSEIEDGHHGGTPEHSRLIERVFDSRMGLSVYPPSADAEVCAATGYVDETVDINGLPLLDPALIVRQIYDGVLVECGERLPERQGEQEPRSNASQEGSSDRSRCCPLSPGPHLSNVIPFRRRRSSAA